MRNTILLTFFLLAGIARSQVAIDTATDFTVKDIQGLQHHLYSYLDAGNYVVIDFYTTNCGPCQTYASEVSASYDYFGCNGGNVVYMGINWGSDNNAVHLFDSLWGAQYPSVSGLQGGGNNVVDAYQVQSYPSVILIAPDRAILNNHIWPPQRDTINAEVLAAGGFPQPCTVGVNEPDNALSSAIQAVSAGQGSMLIGFNRQHGSVATLQIFSSDGRLTQACQIRASQTEQRLTGLKPGIYIARLSEAGRQPVSVKFTVN